MTLKYLSNIKLTNNKVLEIDLIQFNPNTPDVTPNEREIIWNLEEGTFDVGLTGITAQMFEELFFRVKAVGPISKGDIVIFAGSTGDNLLATRAINSFNLEAHYIMGVAAQDIANEAIGKVTGFGKIRNINTLNFDDAEDEDKGLLYISSETNGKLTNIKPSAPYIKSTIAAVTRWHANAGSIFVRPDLGIKLKDIHDINIEDPQDGDVLSYDAENNIWKNIQLTSSTTAENISFDRNQIFPGMTSTNVQNAIAELYTILKFTTGLYVEGGNSTSVYDTSMISDAHTSIVDPNTIVLSGGAS